MLRRFLTATGLVTPSQTVVLSRCRSEKLYSLGSVFSKNGMACASALVSTIGVISPNPWPILVSLRLRPGVVLSQAVLLTVDRTSRRLLRIVHAVLHCLDCPEVSVNGSEIVIRHVAECPPRHHRIELSRSHLSRPNGVDERGLGVIANSRR